MLIAPTEPADLRAIGTTSLVTETFGADVLLVGHANRLHGVQRKELADLLASAEDGRLGQQVNQMRALDVAWLVVEGRPREVGVGGPLAIRAGFGRDWTMSQVRRLLWSVAARGVHVDWTADLADTIRWVKDLGEWAAKETHDSLFKRGPVPRDEFGVRLDGVFLHMGLPGVGFELAKRLVEAGGVIGAKNGAEELMMGVRGMGKVKVGKVMKVLE